MSENTAPSAQLTLAEIVAALIRITALKFSLYSFGEFISALTTGRFSSYSRSQAIRPSFGVFVSFAIVLLGAYWLWKCAGFLARHIARGHNSALPACTFDLRDLYCFAFVFVGLECFVESFGPALTWLHYALLKGSSDSGLTAEQRSNFYTLFKYLVKLIIGLALIFNAPKLTHKLVRLQSKPQP